MPFLDFFWKAWSTYTAPAKFIVDRPVSVPVEVLCTTRRLGNTCDRALWLHSPGLKVTDRGEGHLDPTPRTWGLRAPGPCTGAEGHAPSASFPCTAAAGSGLRRLGRIDRAATVSFPSGERNHRPLGRTRLLRHARGSSRGNAIHSACQNQEACRAVGRAAPGASGEARQGHRGERDGRAGRWRSSRRGSWTTTARPSGRRRPPCPGRRSVFRSTLPALGSKRLDEITTEDVQVIKASLAGHSPKTAKTMFSTAARGCSGRRGVERSRRRRCGSGWGKSSARLACQGRARFTSCGTRSARTSRCAAHRRWPSRSWRGTQTSAPRSATCTSRPRRRTRPSCFWMTGRWRELEALGEATRGQQRQQGLDEPSDSQTLTGDPDGIRTHVPSVRGWCPNRCDDGAGARPFPALQ